MGFQDSTLQAFDRVSLEDIQSVSLQNRMDAKFLMSEERLSDFLSQLHGAYVAVEIEETLQQPYKTVYYDTPELDYYLMHHNGKLCRQKFRTRAYEVTGQVFDEVKLKSNKGKTMKSRVARDSFHETFDETTQTFVQEITTLPNENLAPQLTVHYKRLTLVDKNFSERLTIDTDLYFHRSGISSGFENLVIVELKREKGSHQSASVKALQAVRSKRTGFSKYCMGIALTEPNIKKNRFKEKLRTVQKLCRSTGDEI